MRRELTTGSAKNGQVIRSGREIDPSRHGTHPDGRDWSHVSEIIPALRGRRAPTPSRTAVQIPSWAGPALSFARQVNWRAARRAPRACCCPAKPVIIAVVPPSKGLPKPWTCCCAHHYRRSRAALAAAGAALLHISGLPVSAGAWPEIWATSRAGSVPDSGHMRSFHSWDGTELAYRVVGSGPPLVCIPGGPGQAVEYLGDLGGLSSHRTLILLDNRGTGGSQAPQDPVTYRVDQLVRDVEALRDHLGLTDGPVRPLRQRRDLPAVRRRAPAPARSPGAGGSVPARRRHSVRPERSRGTGPARSRALVHRSSRRLVCRGRIGAGAGAVQVQRRRGCHREWNAAAQAQTAAEPAQFARPATDGFYADFTPDPALPTRLAALAAPVLRVAGEYDIWPTCAAVRELAALFGQAWSWPPCRESTLPVGGRRCPVCHGRA